MNKEAANIEAKKIFEWWNKQRSQIEKDAKEKGTWKSGGLDSNNHLFKDIDIKAKEKLKSLSSSIDETQ